MNIKAGARHSAADMQALDELHALTLKMGAVCDGLLEGKAEAWIATSDIQQAHDYAAKLGATCKGQPATKGDAGEGEGEELKAISLDEQVEAVRNAVWRELGSMRESGNLSSDVYAFVHKVYPDFAIVDIGIASYRVPYALNEEGATIPPRADWQLVEVEYSPSLAVKSLGDNRIGGYAVRFGSPDEPDLSEARDFFTKSTEFWLDKWGLLTGEGKIPMLYHHAQEGATADEPVIGVWTKALVDDVGVWLEGELDKAHKYREAVLGLVKRGVLAQSTDSAPHLVKRRKAAKGTNEVVRWPVLASSLTPTPAEPRLLPVDTIKAAYKALGVTLDVDLEASPHPAIDTEAEGATAQSATGVERERLMLALDLLEL